MRLNSRCVKDLSWEDWLRIAAKDGDGRRQSIVAAQRSSHKGPVSEHRARYALRRVAGVLNAETLTPDEYESGRLSIVSMRKRAEQVRRGPGAAVVEMLPTANQIQQARTWPEALRVAELAPPPRPTPVRRGPSIRAAGLPAPEAQAWFARYNGRYAGHRRLREFCEACDVSLADWPKGRPYSECHDEADEILRSWDLPVPSRQGRKREGGPGRLKDFELPPNAEVPGAPPKEDAVQATDEEQRELCVQALMAFVVHLRREHPGVHPGQKRYLTWQKGTVWPSHSRFTKHGGFTTLRKEAEARL